MVRHRRLAPVLLAAALAVPPAAAGSGTAAGPPAGPDVTRPAGPDATPPQDCPNPSVPESRSVAGVTDAGQDVSLDVHVLLDGIPPASARETIAAAATAYAPLKVTLRARYREVRIPADGTHEGSPTGEVGRLMADTMRLSGGRRPKGSDVVLLLTGKRLWIPAANGAREYGFDGQAECIGGIRWPERAFAIAVGATGKGTRTQHEAAVTAAHEVGHLLGADHQHANCVEGPPPRVCTVMLAGNYSRLDVNSLRFGTAEAAIVRGHAVDHAGT